MFRAFIVVVTVLGLLAQADASVTSAWEALHSLDIVQARAEFKTLLAKSPNDPQVLRGALLAAHFDLDDTAQVTIIKRLAALPEPDPFLLAVFEHVAAELATHYEQRELEASIGRKLLSAKNPLLQYCGRSMLHQVSLKRSLTLDSTRSAADLCSGAWVCGPFDNQSNIAMFRRLPFEGETLDTATTARGKLGSLVAWDYVEQSQGGISLSPAIEDSDNSAGQLRAFFLLPAASEVVVLPGGHYSGRLLVDGVEVHSDPILRNAVIRDGVRVSLAAGAHEITAVLAHPIALEMRLAVLGGDFRPIPGLKWLRYAAVKPAESLAATKVHPLFDAFAQATAAERTGPDARFWGAMMQVYNGYVKEAIRDLERLDAQDSLSRLEQHLLYDALVINGEEAQAGEQILKLYEAVEAPLVEAEWITATAADYAASIKSFAELRRKYPNRPIIELTGTLEPLLNGNVGGCIEALKQAKARFPWFSAFSQLLSTFYLQQLGDKESGYAEFKEYCEKSQSGSSWIMSEYSFLAELGRIPEAIAAAATACRIAAYRDKPMYAYLDVLAKGNRLREMLPLLDSLIAEHPGNVELYSMKYPILQSLNDIAGANMQLQLIHQVKPAATLPYQRLDSLRNGCSLDSIFGTPDLGDLWKTDPTAEQKGDASRWLFLDRRQTLLFESGVHCVDFHIVSVLLDQEGVEGSQEVELGFTESDANNKLLVARRLRKSAAPVEAKREGGTLYFQDLQPGDAIEIRRRQWGANDGDLYQHFWQEYMVGANTYQRRWEFAVLTNRGDLRWETAGPVPQPQLDRYCGFQRLHFSGEHVAATSSDLELLPAPESVLGKIFVSTMADWRTLHDWYYSISQAILAENPRAVAWAERLKPAAASQRALVQDLYSRVVLDIPYQTLDFNYDGSIPQRPDDVILNRWGDCKDKSHLLIAMLRTAGIPAWPVLVMTRNEGDVLPMPYFGFDHLILGCIVDADTIFVDPSATPITFERSLSESVAGQPALEISGVGRANLRTLPPFQIDDAWARRNLILTPNGAQLEFVYDQVFYNVSAANRRDGYFGKTDDAYRRELEAALAKTWETDVAIDSIRHDSLPSTAGQFLEVVYGRVPLREQKIGTNRIITLPNLSSFARSYPAAIAPSQTTFARIPVDLWSLVGRYERSIEFQIPADWGTPELAPAESLTAVWGSARMNQSWDSAARRLKVEYLVEINNGQYDRIQFAEFIRKLIDLYTTPLLLQKS